MREGAVSILEIIQSRYLSGEEKRKQWDTWKFLQMPKWYRQQNKKEYMDLDWEKIRVFEETER